MILAGWSLKTPGVVDRISLVGVTLVGPIAGDQVDSGVVGT